MKYFIDLYRMIINKKSIFLVFSNIIIISYNYYMFVNTGKHYYITYIFYFDSNNFIEILLALWYYTCMLIPIYSYMKDETGKFGDNLLIRYSKLKYIAKKVILILEYTIFLLALYVIIVVINSILFKQNMQSINVIFYELLVIIFFISFSIVIICSATRNSSKGALISTIILFLLFTLREYYIKLNINDVSGFGIIIEIVLLYYFICKDRIDIKKGET